MATLSSTDRPPFRRGPLLAGLALFAAAVLLRAAFLNRHGLWGDEMFSLGMATGHSLEHAADRAEPERGDYVETPEPVAASYYRRLLEHETPPAGPDRVVRAVLLSDTSPPLYYLLLYGWTLVLGTGDAALRAFSLLWALACYPLLWALARRFGGRAARLPVLLLYTVAPVCVYYSTEGRHYSLLWFWTVCTMYLTLRLQEGGFRAGWFLLWVLVSAAGFLTHYFYAFAWGAAAAWLLLYPRRLARFWLVAGCLLVGLLILPWYMRLPESLANWRVTGTWLNVRPKYHDPLLAWLRVPWSFFSTRVVWGDPSTVEISLELLSGLAFGLLAVLAGWKLGGAWFRRGRGFLWFWLLAPIAGIAVFDLWRQTYVVAMHRYVLAGMPAALLLAGLGLGKLGLVPRLGILALIATAHLGGVAAMYQGTSRMWAPFREVGRHLAQKAGAGDLVIVHSVPVGVAGVARYTDRHGAPDKPGPGFASWVVKLGNRKAPEDLQRLAAGRKRIFLVKIHDVDEPAAQETWLRGHPDIVLMRRTRLESAVILTFVPLKGATFFP